MPPVFCQAGIDPRGKCEYITDIMTKEQSGFLSKLIGDKNYLGAVQYVKELSLDKSEHSARIGKIISSVVDDLDSARSNNNRERTVYLRSVLSWILRDYPGLASIYREQLRISSGNTDVLPELARGVRNVGDVLSGKKTIQEGVDDASEPLENIAGQAGELFKDGLNRVGEFLSGFSREDSSTEENDAPSSEEPGIKVEVEDDPSSE